MNSPNSKQSKRINARIMKWREMLEKGIFSDKNLLVKRTRKGIPSCLRIKVWPQLVQLKTYTEKQKLTYSKVLLKDSLDVYDINLDIPRTFSFESQQILRKSLFNVLKALSIQFPQIGYCQGMNFLSMRILQLMNDEVSYQLISYLIKKHKQVCDSFRNPGFIRKQASVFKDLLKKFIPNVSKKLEQDNIDPIMYSASWFITLFSKGLCSQKFYRFFEIFLLEGYLIVYKTALGLVKLKQQQILENEAEDNLVFMTDMDFYETIDDDLFVQTLISFEIPLQLIKQIQKQYSNQHRNTLAKMEQNVQQTYSKKKNNPRSYTEWTMQQFQNENSQFITFSDNQ